MTHERESDFRSKHFEIKRRDDIRSTVGGLTFSHASSISSVMQN